MTPDEMKDKAIRIMLKRFQLKPGGSCGCAGKMGQEANEGADPGHGAVRAGLAATGEVCGNVVGALAAFGLMFSRSREEDGRVP